MTLSQHLRWTLLIIVAGGTAVAAWWLPDATSLWLAPAVGLALPLAVAPLALAIEIIVGAIVDPRQPRAPLTHVMAVWWGESLTSLRVFLWRQPFATGVDEPVVHDPQRPAVLLVHGYLCNRAVWQPLIASGVLNDCNVATVSLTPVFGGIDDYADGVRDAVDRLLAASGARNVIVVCHSMGGLATRAYLRRHGDACVLRVITLATPHHGTVFGRLGFGTNAKQMATGSAYITDLAASESAERRAKFFCIATRDDNLVVPRSSPLLPGARQFELDRVGHLALTEDGRAWRLVADEIRSAARS